MPQASLPSFFGRGRTPGGKVAPKPAAAEEVVAVDSDVEEPPSKKARSSGDSAEVAQRTPVRGSSSLAASAEDVTPMKEPRGQLPALEPLGAGEEDWLPLAPGAKGALPAAWAELLAPELRKPYFAALRRFLREEALIKNQAIFPPASEVFSGFHACEPDAVRAVVIGQDPYHDVGQAHGLAFSVKRGFSPLPPSLKNMLKEVQRDPALPPWSGRPPHGCLEQWAKQGVLLLNTCLTVRAHQANSHQQKGWEQFTDAVVRALSQRSVGLVFLLWGLPAQKKGAVVSALKHAVIKTSHPSPLSATRPSAGNPAFIGSGCFSRCNQELLKRKRGPPIDWRICE